MHFINCFGHVLMKQYTKNVYQKHVGINEDSFTSKKKEMDDYIIQKNYFKSKKDAKIGII